MKTENSTWTPDNSVPTESNQIYQTLCGVSPGISAVQGTPDCNYNSKTTVAGQEPVLNSSDYCAKIIHIPVSGGRFEALVDEADYPLVADSKWCIFKSKTSKILYAQRRGGELMHRVIAGAHAGDGLRIDHRDGNGLNNTRHNIRVGSQSQNRANSRKHKKTSTDYKGVSPNGKKWKAECGTRKDRHYLGLFATPELAAAAYNKKALEVFGPFACLNVIPHPAL